MNWTLILCYLGLASTLYMTGVVWFAQLVHYPLLGRNTDESFADFAREYQRRTLWVVTPGLAGELASAILLVIIAPQLTSWLGLLLLAAIWLMTVRFQIPQHLALKRGYSAKIHRYLVQGNLVRSLLWTIRAGVMIWTTIALSAG
ncbi:MAG: hypothetical protein VX346_16980 [Planctomycetota bacterium]|nr:hypothetical protein [Planctomycetota bacterium]